MSDKLNKKFNKITKEYVMWYNDIEYSDEDNYHKLELDGYFTLEQLKQIISIIEEDINN